MQSKHTLPVPIHSSISSILARPYYWRHSHRKPPSLLALLFVDTRGRPEMKDGFLQSVRPEMRCHEQEQEDGRADVVVVSPPLEPICSIYSYTTLAEAIRFGLRGTLTFNCEEGRGERERVPNGVVGDPFTFRPNERT